MLHTTVNTDVRRWRAALFAVSLLIGVTFASWVTRTPFIRDAVGASTAEMGLIIAGLSVGSLLGILSASPLVARWGGRPVLGWGVLSMVTGLVVVALGAALGASGVVFLGLALVGGGMGSSEIAQNVEGAEVERETGGSFLPAMHGAFSLGTFVGAVVGMAVNAAQAPVHLHLGIGSALMAAVGFWAVRNIPPGTGRTNTAETGADTPRAPRARVWREPRVLMIGVVVLGMALAEGSAADWLPLIMVDGFEVIATAGSAVYALFGLSMAAGRFAGGPLLNRFDRVPVVRASAVAAAVGVVLVMFAPSMAIGVSGVVLWGLGTSLGFPLALSAAGDDPRDSAARVGAVATMGYLAFLVGPPLLGEEFGLRGAIAVVMAMLLVTGAFAAQVRRPAHLDRG